MSSFSFWMTLFPPPHLPPSLPFGHIAYKSQAILVSGLQKAWPPGKSVQDCRDLPDQNSQTFFFSVCLCVCAFFPPSSIRALIFSFRSDTAQEQVCCVTSSTTCLPWLFVDFLPTKSSLPCTNLHFSSHLRVLNVLAQVSYSCLIPDSFFVMLCSSKGCSFRTTSDWYWVTQTEKYKEAVRGRDRETRHTLRQRPIIVLSLPM